MRRKAYWLVAAAGLCLSTLTIGWGQEEQTEEVAVNADHSECVYFGPKRAQFAEESINSRRKRFSFSDTTVEVISRLGAQQNFVPGGSRTSASQKGSSSGNLIDKHIFGVLQDKGIQPAARIDDYEFARRASLDLTGRVPKVDRLTAFVADQHPDKRAKYVDELLASEAWIDKWTMFLGDLYRNTDVIRATNTRRRAEGREAFYNWIYNSLKSDKGYDKMAFELIAAAGNNTWTQGELNWQLGNRTTGGPVQDHFDQMASATAETFLGNSHFNCIVCHNGRGHVDTLSLWGKGASRMQAYGFSAFFAQTNFTQQPRAERADPNLFYWGVEYNRNGTYALNTTTGNRPPRSAIGSTRVAAPVYPFGDQTPSSGEQWRAAAARMVTSDFNFARSTANRIWKELMVRGLVEPVNQLDPARLDPDNPPPAPWTLQPSNAALLRDLGQSFVDNGYSLKALMKQIATSDAYQLSARYDGQWNPAWESLHARRLAKRLMAEEIYDAVVQTSNIPAPITFATASRIPNGPAAPTKVVQSAMQTTSPSSRGGAAGFLNPFYPGDREDTDRRRDGSDQQALTLMNNNLVMTRTRSSLVNGQPSLLRQHVDKSNRELIDSLYLAVLSRYPNESERATATAALSAGNRTQAAENLLWSLYNKVDFFFNY
ncbi:MAG: DUF1549 domain-containing protein [Acidobacteria bacterium]|nr:DUF1549 domain-containing protein [Acidobacteriota bacterium]